MANTNIEIAAQLNALLLEQNKSIQEQIKLNQTNFNLMKSVVDAFSKMNLKGQIGQLEEIKKAQEGATEAAKNLGTESQTASQKMIEKIVEATGETLKLGNEVTKNVPLVAKLGFVGANAMDGFMKGLKLTVGLISNVSSLAIGLTGRLFDVGKSILAIPFKILTGLINDASSGGGDNSLAQALENIRKEFGQLRETAGKAIIDIARGMKGELSNTGLSVYRVFGNLADRLATVMEYAKNMGALFEVLAPNLVRNAEAFGAFNKGLGLTEDGIKAVSTRAYALGQDVTEVQRQLANYSLQLGSQFGLSAKLISRDVGTMMNDFKNFGSLSIREMTQLSVYTRKLGVELKAVAGVIDRFDNFEDAAKGAAQLSQAFGLNLDAISLLKAQNPAERIEALRKSFFAAGRSIETMTRQERRLLAQQTGLDDSALDLTFSLKNQSISYADIQKKGAAAQKAQLSQAEAMVKLSGAIERLVKSGGSFGAGGFLDRFIQGFEVGIKRSREYRQLMINLRRDLRDTFYAGVRVGREFVKTFPGVKQVLGGLADLFQPRRWKGMLNGVVNAFKDFFKNMTTNPSVALPKLLDRLKDNFFAWLEPNSSKGRQILNGVKSFFQAFGTIARSVLKVGIEGITKGIRFLTNAIKNGFQFDTAGPKTKGQELIKNFIDGAKKFFVDVGGPQLFNSLKDLFGVLFDKAKGYLKKHAGEIFLTLFAPSIVGAVVRGGISALATSITSSLFNFLTSGLIKLAPRILMFLGRSLLFAAPTVLAAAGIAGLGALILGYIFKPQETQKFVDSMLDKLKVFVSKAGEYVGIALGYVIDFLIKLPARVVNFVKNLPTYLKTIVPMVIEGIRKALTGLVGIAQTVINTLLNGIKGALLKQFPEYANIINGVFNFIKGFVDGIFGFIKNTINTISGFWNILSIGASYAFDFIIKGATIFFNSISGIVKAITGVVTGVFETIKNPITTSLDFIKNAFDRTFGFAVNAVRKVEGVIDRIFGNSVHDVVRRDLEQTTPIANRWSNTLINAAERAENGVSAASNNISQNIQDSLTSSSRNVNNELSNRTISVPVTNIEPSVANLTTSVQTLRTLNEQLGLLAQQNTIEAIPVIENMIKGINNISQQLSQIRPINLTADLQRLAHNVGLGNSNDFTINHRDFKIQIELRVNVGAEELENVLISRVNSRIATIRGRSGI